ncbi:DUF6090 family protein [Robiginitalea sp. SC105]|uniref:DUF6090 family protein n=1 Tax=Robiginitalea sp. SC105 TaxID=2762332 RepID=UPI001639E0FC|nr:hypothetical protein [Robiginitalea sp. SC105]
MIYAIGEIVLVVIGILIALQINNWNELRKKALEEYTILDELATTLGGDLEHQKDMIGKNKASREAIAFLLTYLEGDLPWSDSIATYFTRAHSRGHGLARAHAYQNAKAHGLDFLQTDSLKELLTWTYEVNTDWLAELNSRNNLYESETVIPLTTRLFRETHISDIYVDLGRSMYPMDFEGLRGNAVYLSVLRTTDYKRQEFLYFQERRYRRMLRLRDMLQEELALKQAEL